jgi:predicted amidophosphoribosyltransferase
MDELAHTVAVPRYKRAADAARAVFGAALDLALPRMCAACREPVEGQGLCPTYWSKLSFITRPWCERLGIPFVYDSGPGILSMEAIADPPAYQRARAAVRFDDISCALVHGLKYSDRLDLVPMMGGGLTMPAAKFWPGPTPSSRYRCTGAGGGRDASTNR